jgi:hypothetical protein
VIIQENIKTRMEIKQYCDQKIATMIETVKTEGKDIIGSNFAEFDRRIHELSQKLVIKMIIAIFTTILLACLVYYIIKRKIEKKHMPKAMNFREVSISPTQIGIIAEPIKTETTSTPAPTIKPQTTTPPKELPIFPEAELSPKTPLQIHQEAPQQAPYQPPTFPNLQQPIILSPRERDQIIREQEEVETKRKKEAEKMIDKLLTEHNKIVNKRNKLQKKLKKPQQEKKELEENHDEIQKQIDDISQKYNIKIPPPE